MIPMNFGAHGNYLNTGTWSTRAIAEARTISSAKEIWSDAENGFRRVPQDSEWALQTNARYLHYTSNNTIYGTQYHHIPQTTLPLITDMSSDFLSRPMDVSAFDLIYAGAQKYRSIRCHRPHH